MNQKAGYIINDNCPNNDHCFNAKVIFASLPKIIENLNTKNGILNEKLEKFETIMAGEINGRKLSNFIDNNLRKDKPHRMENHDINIINMIIDYKNKLKNFITKIEELKKNEIIQQYDKLENQLKGVEDKSEIQEIQNSMEELSKNPIYQDLTKHINIKKSIEIQIGRLNKDALIKKYVGADEKKKEIEGFCLEYKDDIENYINESKQFNTYNKNITELDALFEKLKMESNIKLICYDNVYDKFASLNPADYHETIELNYKNTQ